jgi:RNA polymerase sigma-70 factor, ECF subfamily
MGGPDDGHPGGDRFESLYRGSYEEIFAYVLRRAGGDTETVADLVAEIFVVALRKQAAIPPPPEDRLWLYGVARRAVLDHGQRRRRLLRLQSRLRERVVLETGSGDGEPSHLRVRDAIEMLRPADRELLKLVAWDGLSHAEAARLLGCTPNAVGQRLHKARSRLRSILSQPGPPARASASLASDLMPFSSRSQP